MTRRRQKPQLPNRDEVIEWLQSKHIATWGQYFTLQKERTGECADWILDQLQSLLDHTHD